MIDRKSDFTSTCRSMERAKAKGKGKDKVRDMDMDTDTVKEVNMGKKDVKKEKNELKA